MIKVKIYIPIPIIMLFFSLKSKNERIITGESKTNKCTPEDFPRYDEK
jgi:hypothetical protein